MTRLIIAAIALVCITPASAQSEKPPLPTWLPKAETTHDFNKTMKDLQEKLRDSPASEAIGVGTVEVVDKPTPLPGQIELPSPPTGAPTPGLAVAPNSVAR